MFKDEADKTENMASNSENISTENIFEDFQNDSELQDQIIESEIEIKKDNYYYLNLVGDIFKYINIIFFVIFLIGFSYIYIQKSESGAFDNSPFLQVACPVLVGDTLLLEESTCSPVKSSIKNYNDKIKKQKEVTLEKSLVVLKEAYIIEDLINSDKVGFVLDKTQNKQNLLFILTKFDNLKKSFTGLDKSQIQCSNINIKDNKLSANCSAYSSSWNSGITGFNGSKGSSDTVAGTSISIASSFLNYLELDPNISLESKQTTFSQENVIGGAYTNKTSFDVNLIYKTDILSF